MTPTKKPLTDAYLRSLKPPAEGDLLVRDPGHAGLELRIRSGGAATWAIRARKPDGERVRVTLGRYPTIGLAAARKAATVALAAVQGGRNPVEEKRQATAAREAAAAEPTVQDCVEAWLAARAPTWRPSTYETAEGHMRRLVLPKLGKRTLRGTMRADWVGLVEEKRRTHPGGAATAYRWIQSFLNDAEASGWIDAPLLPRKGAQRIAPQGAARERALSDDELRDVWRAAGKLSAKPRAFVRLLILTAARREEVAGIQAEEIDLSAATWMIPAARSKNGTALTVPLSNLAMAEIHAVLREDATGHLLGRHASGSMSGFSKIKAQLNQLLPADMAAWRLHDLRRTARTGMGRLGVADTAAEAALNHLSGRSALVRTYDRHDYAAEATQALTTWQGHVTGLAGAGAEVVPLPKRV
ncbi:integrase arm-type DNA-binding domain-containing protein [Roseomonas sp. CAU 1739]|uniref:tyrosine-type recombinase/integrase n=1 Tax=Roseomonas sp. CAU 1739 TaxID=3140364 RepID=UPI00325B6DD8